MMFFSEKNLQKLESFFSKEGVTSFVSFKRKFIGKIAIFSMPTPKLEIGHLNELLEKKPIKTSAPECLPTLANITFIMESSIIVFFAVCSTSTGIFSETCNTL